MATVIAPTRTAATAARTSRFLRRARSVIDRAKSSSSAVSFPAYRSRHSSNSRKAVPAPQHVRRAPFLLPQVRRLLQLIAQDRPLLVLRLPPHEPRPRLQQRLVHHLHPVVARLSLPPFHLVRRQQPLLDQLAQHLLGVLPLREDRQQLLAVHHRPRPLRGDEVAEDLADDPLSLGADPVHRGLGVLGEGAGHTPDLVVGRAREELPLPVPLLPQPRHREGEKRQRPRAPSTASTISSTSASSSKR